MKRSVKQRAAATLCAACLGLTSWAVCAENTATATGTETAVPTGTTTGTAVVQPAGYGDVNADGAVDMKDVLLLRKFLAHMAGELHVSFADVNADGAVDMKDVLLLRKHLAHMDVVLGQPQGQILLSGDGYTVVLADERADGTLGYELRLFCQNDGGEALYFSLERVAVNGYMVDPFWAVKVPVGEAVTSTATLWSAELERAGISAVEKIEADICVTAESTAGKGMLDCRRAVWYPTGLSEGEVTVPARDSLEDEQVLLDDEVAAVVQERAENGAFGYTQTVYLHNRTDADFTVLWQNVSVNGQAIDPLWRVEVSAGNRARVLLHFLPDQLQDAGVDAVESLSYTLAVVDADGTVLTKTE